MIKIQVDEATAARRRIPIYCVDAGDGMTPETGEAAGQPQLSKNGAAHGNTSATLTAIGSGDYYVELTAGEVDTIGLNIVRYKSANTAEAKVIFQVVSYDPYDPMRMGLTSLPNAAADAAGGLPISDAGGLDSDELAKDRQIIIDMIEHQRGTHTVQGSIFYVDPVNGDTHANGNRGGYADPYNSVQDCHDNAVTTYAHDCIMLVAGHASAQTVLTEQITISKSRVMIRGPGRGFKITYGSPGDTITVTGNGVELSGFLVSTHIAGTSDAIVIQSDFCLVRQVWFDSARSDGISIESADWCLVEDCFFNSSGNGSNDAGIRIGGSSDNTYLNRVFIRDQTGSGVVLSGTVDHTSIQYSNIDACSVYGVDVSVPGVNDTMIWQCFLHDNTSGDLNDAGTDTHQENSEQWAKHSIATEARLAELDQANLPTDVAAIPTTMVGTDSAALASVWTEARAGALTDWIDEGRLDAILDGIKAVTDNLPNSGALTTIGTDTARLTAARAGVLTDWINAGRLDALLDGIKAVTDNLPNSGALTTIGADTARLTAARAGALTDWINAGRLDTLLDLVLSRLSSARAGYLDELGSANLPADVDTLLSRLSAARAGYLDELAAANLPSDLDDVLAFEKADVYLDTTTTPWTLVKTVEGVGAELHRQKLYDVNGVAVDAVTTRVTKQLRDAP